MSAVSEIAANIEVCKKAAADLQDIGDFKLADMWLEAARVWEALAE